MSNVFIAPKIKVGFQKRSDTFTGQLAYIIYFDEKGKLRKEKSWEGWRDKKIAPQEFDNAPMDGFTLNKDVQRNHEWFGSGRNMIRIHDPRGFEFEVTCENLIEILMHTDCLRRGLVGQFVYAWFGPELVLLPTNSEEYQNSVKYTAGLSKKVSVKNLVAGISYKTKREGDVVYIGRFNWYEYGREGGKYSNNRGPRKEEKVHVFTYDNGKSFFKKSSMEFLAEPNSDQPVSNFAELVDKFNKKTYANKVVRYEFRPTTFDESVKNEQWYGPRLRRQTYFHERSPGLFTEARATVNTERQHVDGSTKDTFTIKNYDISFEDWYGHSDTGIKADTGELVEVANSQPRQSDRYYYGYSRQREESHDLAWMQAQKLFDLYLVYENGKQKRITSLGELNNEQYAD